MTVRTLMTVGINRSLVWDVRENQKENQRNRRAQIATEQTEATVGTRKQAGDNNQWTNNGWRGLRKGTKTRTAHRPTTDWDADHEQQQLNKPQPADRRLSLLQSDSRSTTETPVHRWAGHQAADPVCFSFCLRGNLFPLSLLTGRGAFSSASDN